MVLFGAIATLALAGTAVAQVASRKMGVTRFAWQREQEPGSIAPSAQELAAAVQQFQPYNFSMPVDHFKNSSKYEPHSNGFFNVTYYYDASYYKPGGPVILLATGEDSAVDRVPFLQQGLLHQLAKATNGIGVILEHRYYGNSFPVPDLSVKNLRFHTTEQALADSAYFAQHIQFPGVKYNVTSYNTPWFAYGGSYAGAFVAFLRTLYPGVFWGSFSSSGVTAAINDYWQYNNPIQDFGPQQCIQTVQKLTDMVDNIFEHNGAYNKTLRQAFGLDNITHNEDFTSVLSSPTGYWQARNWNPAINSNEFFNWCNNLTATHLTYPATAGLKSTAQKLLQAGGYGYQEANLTTALLNWIGYVNATAASACPESSGQQDQCFALNLPSNWAGISTSDWPIRSWTYQVCTQWGYFISGNGRPKGDLGIVSRLQTVPYLSKECELAFGITKLPDNSQINSWGSFDLNYPRILFLGGEADPWRDATPLAESRWPKGKTGPGKTAKGQLAYLIHTDDFGAVHHWDENGVPDSQYTSSFPPQPIKDVQSYEAATIKQWIKQWNSCKFTKQPGYTSC